MWWVTKWPMARARVTRAIATNAVAAIAVVRASAIAAAVIIAAAATTIAHCHYWQQQWQWGWDGAKDMAAHATTGERGVMVAMGHGLCVCFLCVWRDHKKYGRT